MNTALRKWAVFSNDLIREKPVDNNKKSSFFDQQIEV